MQIAKRDLIFFDIANVPPKKNEGSVAKGVSYHLEFYNYDNGTRLYKSFIGKWIRPSNLNEKEEGIDIPPDQYGKRLSPGYVNDRDGIIRITDAHNTLLYGDGDFLETPYIAQEGDFVVVATVTGKNIWDMPQLIFKLENRKGEIPKFYELKDGEYWLEKANQSEIDIWDTI